MKPSTKAWLARAASMHAVVYSGVRRLPAELISARSRRPRAWGGGPRSWRAFFRFCGLCESLLLESERIRFAGCGGDVSSKVCDMVVVAVLKLPASPFFIVCEKSVCGGLALVLGSGLGGDETGMG